MKRHGNSREAIKGKDNSLFTQIHKLQLWRVYKQHKAAVTPKCASTVTVAHCRSRSVNEALLEAVLRISPPRLSAVDATVLVAL